MLASCFVPHQKIAICTITVLREAIVGAASTRTLQTKLNRSSQVLTELTPVYQRLGEKLLLSRCVDGKTQNQNESLNGMIRDRVPKDVFVSTDVIKLARCLGCCCPLQHWNKNCSRCIDRM